MKIAQLPLGDRPAFPVPSAEHGGVSVRQWLYGQALKGLLSKDGAGKLDETVRLAGVVADKALIVLSQQAAGPLPVTQAAAAPTAPAAPAPPPVAMPPGGSPPAQ